MWHMSKDEKSYRGITREVDGKWGSRKAVDTFDSWFHYYFSIGNREGYNFGNLW